MSAITIDFPKLTDTKSQSKKVRAEIEDYVDELNSKVSNKITALPGSDPSGYANTAAEAVKSKINELTQKASKFSAYEQKIDTFMADARAADSNVSKKIASIADAKIGKRDFFAKIGDSIYGLFCVDLANSNGIARAISNATRWATQKIGAGFEKVYDWFKYGDGQYVWNALKSVAVAVAAVVVAATAIASMIATFGADSPGAFPIILACIKVVATSVSAIITIGNTEKTIEGNAKAFDLSVFQDNPAAARYYGNIQSQSDYYEKTDMGDKTDNEKYEEKGERIDFAKKLADITSTAVNILQLGNVYDYRYTNKDAHIKGYDPSLKNLRKNFNYKAGYRYMTVDGKTVYQLNASEGFNFTDNFFKPEKVIKNIFTTAEAVDQLNGYFHNSAPDWNDAQEAIESVIDIVSYMDFYDTAFKYTYGVYDKVVDFYEFLTAEPEPPACPVAVGGAGSAGSR